MNNSWKYAGFIKIRMIILIASFGVVAIFSSVAGYYADALRVPPWSTLIPKIEQKIEKIRGKPSEMERNLALIETTFLQLKGKILRPPDADWINGGALTVRGSMLMIMDHRGRFFATDGEQSIEFLDRLKPPVNGLVDYLQVASSPRYDKMLHKPERFRFNDLTWIQTDKFSGFAISYTFFDLTRECYGTRVAWAAVDSSRSLESLAIAPEDWKVVFETKPCLKLNPTWTALDGMMAGGRMAFKPPSTLFLGSGEYHLDGIHTYDAGIQSDASSYGKVIAIDLLDGSSRIVSKGHRNIQGVTLDGSGRLWITEQGVRGGDELNLVKDGGNYGWPLESLGTLYSGQAMPGQRSYGRHDAFEPPIFAWLPSAGVSCLTVVDNIDESWDGDLLAGSLSSTEFGQSLWHIRINGERVVFVERIRLNQRVRYVIQFGKQIAVWMDNNNLVLFTPRRRPDPLSSATSWLMRTQSAAVGDQVGKILMACNECHSFAEKDHRTGPSLNGVVGRAVAGTTFNGYSQSLRSIGGRWTDERLASFLADPGGFAQGSPMPSQGLQKGPVMDALIGALRQVDGEASPDLRYH